MDTKERQDAIRQKGFNMNGSSSGIEDYGKIKVGLKILQDAIIDLGNYKKSYWHLEP